MHCYHYTTNGYPQQQGCVISVYFQLSNTSGKILNKILFHNPRLQSSRFMYNKKESCVVLLLVLLVVLLLVVLLLVVLLIILPTPPPKLQHKTTITTKTTT
jgi:flagellar basal body-associated protein FliL